LGRIYGLAAPENHSKNKIPVSGNAVPVFGINLKQGWCLFLVIFQHRKMFSRINGKLLPKPFK